MWVCRGRHTGSCVVATLCRKRTRHREKGLRRHVGEKQEGNEQFVKQLWQQLLGIWIPFFLVAFFSKPSYLQGSRICRPLWALLIIGSGGKWEFCSVLLRTWSPGIATCLTPSHFSPYWSSLSVQLLSYYIILTMKPLECKGTSIRVVSFHNCSRVPLNWNGFY